MGTLQLRLVLLTTCLLLPACYGQYVIAHEISPPEDCWLDPHRPIRVSDGDRIALQVRLECSEPAREVPLASRDDTSRLMIVLSNADLSELEEAFASQPSEVVAALAPILERDEVQIFQGAGRQPDDRGRFWTESVVLETVTRDSLIRKPGESDLNLILTVAGQGVSTANEGAPLPFRLRSVLQGEGSGSYRLELREAEGISLTSSSLLGIGIVGILSIWLGTQ